MEPRAVAAVVAEGGSRVKILSVIVDKAITRREGVEFATILVAIIKNYVLGSYFLS